MLYRGRQIYFFMTREDEERFVAFLFSQGDVWLIRDQWYEATQLEKYNDAHAFLGQPVIDKRHMTPMWTIWNKTLWPTELQWREIRTYGPGRPRDLSTGERFFVLRPDRDNLIEFSRCVVNNNALEKGRIACMLEYEDEEGALHMKSDQFDKWYKLLAKWIRKQSVRASFDGLKPQTSLYILPGALEYWRNGGNLGSIAGKPGAFQPLRKDIER